jgi:hypothetical protein
MTEFCFMKKSSGTEVAINPALIRYIESNTHGEKAKIFFDEDHFVIVDTAFRDAVQALVTAKTASFS